MRTIHTGLYSDKAFYVIQRLEHFCSNYWSVQMSRNWSYCKVRRDYDGEVVLGDIDDTRYSYRRTFFHKWPNDQDVRNWIANNIKSVCQRRLPSERTICGNISFDDLWNRASNNLVPWFNTKLNSSRHSDEDDPSANAKQFDMTAREIYCMYEILKGRQNVDKHYSDVYADIKGEQFDPIRAEQARVLDEEIKNLNDEQTRLCEEIYKQRYEKERKMREDIYAWYNKEVDRVKSEIDAKIKELRDAFAFIDQMA